MALSLLKMEMEKDQIGSCGIPKASSVLKIVFPYLCRYVEHDDEYSQQYPVDYIFHSGKVVDYHVIPMAARKGPASSVY